MSLRQYSLPLLAFFAVAPALFAQPVVLLNDSFDSGATGNLPTGTSAEWFLNGLPGNGAGATYTQGTVAPGSLAQTFATDQSVTAYFASPGSQPTLNVGHSMFLTFDFTMNGAANVSDGIRVALLNSGSTGVSNFQLTGNSDITSAAPNFANYAGYAAFFNPGTTATNLYSRAAGVDNNLIATGSTAYSSLGAPTLTGSAFSINNTDSYSGALSLSYLSAGTMLMTFALKDITTSTLVSYSLSTSTIPTTQFDAIVLGGLGNAASSFALSNVTFVAAPEPPVYVLCASGLAVLAAAGWWSRRYAARMTA